MWLKKLLFRSSNLILYYFFYMFVVYLTFCIFSHVMMFYVSCFFIFAFLWATIGVLNATARLTSNTRKYDQGLSRLMHQELHWLDIPEQVSYKLCLLTHRCLLGKAPVYLSDYCTPVSQVAARQHLHSAACHRLVVPRYRLSTYGRQAFAVAGPMTFNALPDELRDPTVNTTTFRRLLKTFFSSYLHV